MLAKCLIFATVCVAFVYGACSPCPPVPKHYEELKCKPVNGPDNCCPIRFDCPDVAGFDKKQCHYGGKVFPVGGELRNNLPTCTASCSCAENDPIYAFNCAFTECPEGPEPPKPGCSRTYTLDSCCATKETCDAAEVKKLPKCYLDGTEYHDGNLIYPKSNPCYKCLCNDKFDNSTSVDKNPSCKRVDCGIELHQLAYLQGGCAPVYFNDAFCCPLEFRCPFEEDVVEKGTGKAPASPELTCKYGTLTLNAGDKLKSDDPCVECACSLPPFVQCTRDVKSEKCRQV